MTEYDEYKDAIIFEVKQGARRLTIETGNGRIPAGVSFYDKNGDMLLFNNDTQKLTALRDALNEILAEEAPLPAEVAPAFDPQIRIEALRLAIAERDRGWVHGTTALQIAKSFERYLTGEDVAA